MYQKVSNISFEFDKSPFSFHLETGDSVRLEIWNDDWSLQHILYEGPNPGLGILTLMVESFHDTYKKVNSKREGYEAVAAKKEMYAITYGGVR
jgi:hypothetical protein